MRIYFDNAATTPLLPEVADAMTEVLRDHFGNPSSIHAEGRKARAIIENARKTVANAIGASLSEVFFTSCGTEAANMAIKCSVRDLGVRRIITAPTEHHCVLHTVEHLEKIGIPIVWLGVDERGRINYRELEKHLSETIPEGRTLVCLMHANNEIGTMIDLERVAALCREYEALFQTDTVQTIGHFPINLSQTPVSFLTGSAHKFHGPKGIGFLYVNSDNIIHPYLHGGSQERNMRAGTENVAGIAGLAKALELAVKEMDQRRAHIESLRSRMLEQILDRVSGVMPLGDFDGQYLYTVLNLSFPANAKSDLLLMNLDIAGISASGGSACSSGAEAASHVIQAIGLDPDRKAVRFSFSHLNTLEEVDRVVETVVKLNQ